MDLYVIRRPGAWANIDELKAADAKSADRQRGWPTSALESQLRGQGARRPHRHRLHLPGPRSRGDPEHARKVGMPGDQIFPVLDTIVVRDDPAKHT